MDLSCGQPRAVRLPNGVGNAEFKLVRAKKCLTLVVLNHKRETIRGLLPTMHGMEALEFA